MTTQAMEPETNLYGGLNKEQVRQAALAVLRVELRSFAWDGLTELHKGLLLRTVKRGTWEACPLSYAKGSQGSRRSDSRRFPCNHFTFAWDHDFVSREDVIDAVEKEVLRRQSEMYGEAAQRTEDVAETVAA